MERERKSYLDYIRVFAVFLVLYGHFVTVGSYATSIPMVVSKSNEIKLPIIPVETHIMEWIELFVVKNFKIQTAVVGVVLFMILTGYLSIDSREKNTGKYFIVKRFIRLFPVLFMTTFIAGIVYFLHQGVVYGILQYLATFTLLYPILQYEPIMGPVWVLCVEFIFYLLLLHIKKFKIINLLIINGIILFMVFLQYEHQSTYLVTALYFLKFVPTILIGTAIKLVDTFHVKKRILYTLFFTILAWGIMKLCSLVIVDTSTYTNVETYIAALLIFYGFKLLSKIKYFSNTPQVIRMVNDISYSIYLLQVNVGMAIMFYIKCNITENAYVIVIVSAVLLIMLSMIIHYFWELPSQRYLEKLLIKK